jgi:hypothetical protein
MKVNNWIEASVPPDLQESEYLDLWRSAHVLVFDGVSQRIARYEKWDDCDPKWYSSCSERWELLGIKFWMYLPDTPK